MWEGRCQVRGGAYFGVSFCCCDVWSVKRVIFGFEESWEAAAYGPS